MHAIGSGEESIMSLSFVAPDGMSERSEISPKLAERTIGADCLAQCLSQADAEGHREAAVRNASAWKDTFASRLHTFWVVLHV